MTKLTFGILFSISPIFALKTVVVTKPLASGILCSTSLIVVFKTVLINKPLTFSSTSPNFSQKFVYPSCIALSELKLSYQKNFSKLITFILNLVFLTTFLLTTSLMSFDSIITVLNLPTSKLSTFVFKLFKLIGTLTNL